MVDSELSLFYKITEKSLEISDKNTALEFHYISSKKSPREVYLFMLELKQKNKLPKEIFDKLEEFWWRFCN